METELIKNPFIDRSSTNLVFQSPVEIPAKARLCSVRCAADFLYPNTKRKLSVHKRYTKQGLESIHIDVICDDGKQPDIVFNTSKYRLERIEFFKSSFHKRPKDSLFDLSKGNSFPAEVVLIHRRFGPFLSASNKSHFDGSPPLLAVSVFLTPMFSYSKSQDFLSPLAKLLSDVVSSTEIVNSFPFRIYRDELPKTSSTEFHETQFSNLTSLSESVAVLEDVPWATGIACFANVKAEDNDGTVFDTNETETDRFFKGVSKQFFGDNGEISNDVDDVDDVDNDTNKNKEQPVNKKKTLSDPGRKAEAASIWNRRQGKCFLVNLKNRPDRNSFIDDQPITMEQIQSDILLQSGDADAQGMTTAVTYLDRISFGSIEMPESWNPFNLLPQKKSFFYYPGGSSHKPVDIRRLSSFSEKTKGAYVGWILMENSMPIHEDDFMLLKGSLEKFRGNNGQLLKAVEVLPSWAASSGPNMFREVTYNDGTYVKGSEKGHENHIQLKCSTKDQKSISSKKFALLDSPLDSDSNENTDDQNKILRSRDSEILYFQREPFVNILLWILFVISISGLLYVSDMTRKSGSLFAYMLLIFFGTQFAHSQGPVQLLGVIGTFLFLLFMYFALSLLLGDFGESLDASSSSAWKIVSFILRIVVVVFIAVGGVSIALSLMPFSEGIEKKKLFSYVSPSMDMYISNRGTMVISRFGSIEIKYGLDKMNRIDLSGLTIKPDIKLLYYPRKFTVSSWAWNDNAFEKYHVLILEEYDRQMKDTSESAWNCFKRSVLKYAQTSKKYTIENKEGITETVSLKWENLDDILEDMIPSVKAYLLEI